MTELNGYFKEKVILESIHIRMLYEYKGKRKKKPVKGSNVWKKSIKKGSSHKYWVERYVDIFGIFQETGIWEKKNYEMKDAKGVNKNNE